jgi:NitT/TauT family transport system substrate-binding protein
MIRNRRRGGVVAVAAALAFAAGIAGCGSGNSSSSSSPSKTSSGTKTVKFGYLADYNGASAVAVANAQNLWAKHGLKAQLEKFTAGPVEVQALGAGDIDFGYLGPGALWLPASGKAKIIAINSVGLADRVIAQPSIKSIQDLKGKKVGVPEGTSGDMILRLALEQAGMKITDVQKVVMDPPTIVSAFSSGKIDAAGIWYPLIGTIKKKVPQLNELASDQSFYPNTTFPTAFIASNDLIQKDPELVKRVVATLQEANDYRAAHVDEAVQATAKLIGAPVDQLTEESRHVKMFSSAELASKSQDGTIDNWLSGLEKQFIAFGSLPSQVDPKTFYDGNLYAQANQSK